MKAAFVLTALLASPACAEESVSNANPIRKVVTMLQHMQKKVEADGEAEKELFDKFMCYCKNGAAALEKSIADAGDAIPDLGSHITAAQGQLAQLKEDLKNTHADREAAKAAMAEATGIREKDAAAFDAEVGKVNNYLTDLNKAITALDHGAVPAFLQTDSANQLRNLVEETDDMSNIDREDVTAFLTNQATDNGMIIGILKQMEERFNTTRNEVTGKEEASIKTFDELIAAKTAEVEALTVPIVEKPVRIGDIGVEIVQMKADLSDTEASLLDDKKFAGDLQKNCATKEAEWAEVCKTRSQEQLALADTIKVLNDDDALEMFKKTLPGASAAFIEVENQHALQTRALAILQDAKAGNDKKGDRHHFDFIMLALRGKKAGFGKVVKMIDDMVALLHGESVDDAAKKAYCLREFDSSDDEKKALERSQKKLESSIDDVKESIAARKQEIAALGEGIVALDKSVAEATEQRREENSDYTTLMMNNQAAKELLQFAKNRLNKFYNPKLYRPPAMFMQIAAHGNKAEPGPPPAAPGAHKKQDGNGVIAMIDTLIKGLDLEMTEAKTNEKHAQEEYEEMMADSASKRAADSKSITDKSAAQADGEALLMTNSKKLTSTKKELVATHEYIAQLHAQCDWMLKYFDMRAEARKGEIDSLKKARAVLSGADFSLVQTFTRQQFLHK